MSTLTIHSINPTGMFSYGKEDDINLTNKGLIHLLGVNIDKGGDSNGSGKSSLFNALCEILFGENPTGVKGDGVVNSVWNKGMAGRVMFEASDGYVYRVTYCRNWKDNLYLPDNDNNKAYLGTNLFLDKYDPSEKRWMDCQAKGMPETRKKILDILGISYDRFLAISYMSHRTGNLFLRGTNKDRMDLLAGITGIGEWDLVLDGARKKKKALNSQIDGFNQSIAFEQGSINTLKEQLQSYRSFDLDNHIAGLNQELETARSNYKLTQEGIAVIEAEVADLTTQQSKSYNQETLAIVDQELQSLNIQLSDEERALSMPVNVQPDQELAIKANQLYTEINQCQSEINLNSGPLPVVQAPKQMTDSLSAIEQILNQDRGRLSLIMDQNSNLLDLDNCPTCKGEITQEKKDEIKKAKQDDIDKVEASIKSYEDQAVQLKADIEVYVSEQVKKLETERSDKVKYLTEQLEQLNTSYNQLLQWVEEDKQAKTVKAEEDRAARNLKVNTLRSQIVDLQAKKQKEVEDYQAFSVRIQEKNNEVSQLKSNLAQYQSNGETIKASIESTETRIRENLALESQIGDKEAQVRILHDEITGINKDLKIYLWLIDNIPSIKLHKMSVAMSEISNLVNDYFTEMGESLRVNISAFAEKNKKKHAADVKDLLKAEVALQIVDGTKNISPKLYSDGEISKVSLAIAKALHEMARKSGQGCNLMLLDEIFGFVDTNNSQRMAQSLSSILNKGTVFLTDNSGKVKDLVHFNHTWTATKTQGQTKLIIDK